jgi:acyl-CoA synthetase (NDP forming)
MKHSLDSLLNPASIALVGASNKPGTPGFILADMVINSGFAGSVFPVNPSADEVIGLKCFDDIESLPTVVDHIVLALGNKHLEAALESAITHGAKAVTIYASGILEDDTNPPLLERLIQLATEAKIAICGCNGMGFYNVRDDLYTGIFAKALSIQKGGISYIAQSGSAFTTLCHNGNRLGFNLCVSSGNEITTTIADYMDWSLEQPETRVIGLFLEAVRNPQAFVDALQKASDKNIPVVILKIGKSPLSAKMALTHTGAIAGSQAAFEALYRRYGVISVNDFDEMAATLMLLQNSPEIISGKIATIQESGGFRELIADLAYELKIEFAEIEESTKELIQTHLDPGLKAENPLDAWGSHDNFENRFLACINLLMADPNVAGGVFFSNFRDDYFLSEAIYRAMQAASKKTNKPLVLGNCYSDLKHDEICRQGYEQGIPVIDGARETLLAFKHLFAYQQFKTNKNRAVNKNIIDPAIINHWHDRLKQQASKALSEADAMDLLSGFDIATPRKTVINGSSGLLEAADLIGFPLVLKTAEPGILHKSDAGGVIVNIQCKDKLQEHYADLQQRLGPIALLTQMIGEGVEVGLGIINDPQFGPILMVAAGGILIELLSERAVALCPLNSDEADELLSSLKINALIHGVRGQVPSDRQSLIDTMVKLSQLAYGLRDIIAEIDVNPVIVNPTGAVAVDALIVLK